MTTKLVFWQRVYVRARNNEVCFNDTCIEENDITDMKWKIEIEIDPTIPLTYDEIVVELSVITDTDIDDVIITVEYDDQGLIHRIVVYIDDESKAKKLTERLNSLDSSESGICKGFSFSVREVRMRENTRELSLSTGFFYHANFKSILSIFMTMIFIALSIN